jgi:hypothetical protein
MGNAHEISVGRPKDRKPLVRPKRRWENYMKIYIRKLRLEVADLIHLAQDRDQ